MPEHPEDLRLAREYTSAAIRKMGDDVRVRVKRDDLVEIGQLIWSLTLQKKELDSLGILEELRNQMNPRTPLGLIISSVLLLPDQQITGLAGAFWYDSGLPVIQMGHKYAAALMATNPGTALGDVRPPWKAFLIDVPNGLLTIFDPNVKQRVEVTMILVTRFESSRGPVWSYIAFTETAMSMWKHGARADELISQKLQDSSWKDYSFVSDTDDEDERVNELISRLIINVCLATTDKTENLKKVGKGHGAHRGVPRDRIPPVQRIFKLGKPIVLDCRGAVKDFVEGRSGHVVSVQSLVMGHWKRQAHGPQRSLRKRLWIEPYWRGPEDAPIVQRPHEMGKE